MSHLGLRLSARCWAFDTSGQCWVREKQSIGNSSPPRGFVNCGRHRPIYVKSALLGCSQATALYCSVVTWFSGFRRDHLVHRAKNSLWLFIKKFPDPWKLSQMTSDEWSLPLWPAWWESHQKEPAPLVLSVQVAQVEKIGGGT